MSGWSSRVWMTWRACSSPAELATTRAPTSGSEIMWDMIWATVSRLACPVMSAGLAAQPKPSSMSLMPSRAESESSGSSIPASPRLSAVREQTPPEWETRATPRFLAGGLSARSWGDFEELVPVVDAGYAVLPECGVPCFVGAGEGGGVERAARVPALERPILTATMGLPRSAAIRATSRNLAASLKPSMNMAMTRVSSSSRR